MDSDASKLVTDAIKELSIRAGQRGERAVVKIIYDRGNAKQVCNSANSSHDSEYDQLSDADSYLSLWTITK